LWWPQIYFLLASKHLKVMYASFITSHDIANPIMTAMNGRHVFISYTDLRFIISSGPIDYKKSTSGKQSTRHYRTNAGLQAWTPICSVFFQMRYLYIPLVLFIYYRHKRVVAKLIALYISLYTVKNYLILFQTEALCILIIIILRHVETFLQEKPFLRKWIKLDIF
jgi:hypothetical protein